MLQRWRRIAYFALVISLLLGLFYLFFEERRKILSTQATAWTTDHKADCAIVLTGGPSRVREGFDLLSQMRVKKLIISGVYPAAQLREIFPEWPFYGAINEDDVVLEKRSNTTFGNAQQTQPLVEALKCESLILITSRLHMYRASRLFTQVYGPDVLIHNRAIVSGDFTPNYLDVSLEVIKSLFYSIWAY